MKRHIVFSPIVAACIAVFMFVGCQKDNVTLRARMSNFESGSKVYMDAYSPMWNGGENVVLNGQTVSVQGSGRQVTMTVPTAAVYEAVYPAEYVIERGHLKIPRVQEYETDASGRQLVCAPLGAYCEDDATLLFTPMGSLLAIQVNNNTSHGTLVMDMVSVKASSAALWGTATITNITSSSRSFVMDDPCYPYCNDSVVLAKINSQNRTESLNLQIAQGSTSTLYVYIPAIPLTSSNRFTIRVFTHVLGDADSKYNYALTQANDFSGNIPLAKLAHVPFPLSTNNEAVSNVDPFQIVIEGMLPGEFSVGVNRKVHFSQGNLQYFLNGVHDVADGNTLPGVFKFALRQYDVMGSDNWYFGDPDYNGKDLFGWASSGYHDVNDPGNTYYDPGSYCSIENACFGPYNKQLDITGDNANYDWGVYNAILNGGNYPGLWRTLTKSEWDYIISGRPNAALKYGVGTVDGVSGLVLLPDTWSLPNGCSFTPGVTTGQNDFSLNTYTPEQWFAMETAGAVFLPHGGFISNGYYTNYSRYWSSSTYPESTNRRAAAYFLSIRGNEVVTDQNCRLFWNSVRLCRDSDSQ